MRSVAGRPATRSARARGRRLLLSPLFTDLAAADWPRDDQSRWPPIAAAIFDGTRESFLKADERSVFKIGHCHDAIRT